MPLFIERDAIIEMMDVDAIVMAGASSQAGRAAMEPARGCRAKHAIIAAVPAGAMAAQCIDIALHDSYAESLLLAARHGCRSIALPLLSPAGCGYLPSRALGVAQEAAADFLGADYDGIDVYLVVHGDEAFGGISHLVGGARQYVGAHLINKERRPAMGRALGLLGDAASGDSLQSLLSRLEDSFSTLLVKYIRNKGMSNSEVYKEANMDRRLFSKIISNSGYAPAKSTVLSLVIALRLNLSEAAQLLRSAGYALSHSSSVDLVVEYFISRGGNDCNIFQVNDVLASLDLPQLGSKCWQS